jgi:putative addiction module killer protein
MVSAATGLRFGCASCRTASPSRRSPHVDRLCRGNPGEVKRVGGGVNQMRIDHGPGYRIYFAENDDQIIPILGDGTKKAQAADIMQAKRLVNTLKTKMKTAP